VSRVSCFVKIVKIFFTKSFCDIALIVVRVI
jgi:hypothetical protein